MTTQRPPNGSGETGIVAGSARRIRRDARAEVTRAVHARYAAALATGTWFGRLLIRVRIRCDIRRELRRIAPPDALYAKR